MTDKQIDECGKLAVSFFQHYEQKYMRHGWDRLYLAKSVFHQVLHLEECLREFGPLPYCAQNWVEEYIGWIVDRNSARNRAAESMTWSAFFRESYKAFFSEPFKYSAEHYDVLSEDRNIEFSGSSGKVRISDEGDEGKQFRMLISSYLRRKYDLTSIAAKLLAETLDHFDSFSRARFYCGNGTQSAEAYRAVTTKNSRESCYVAVEMDSSEESADVYYGRVRRFLEFELMEGREETPWRGKNCVALFEWVSGLRVGAQGQVFKPGKLTQVFTSSTIEDAFIISRLVGVAEHIMPRGSRGNSEASRSTQGRGTRRTYFLDARIRVDYLLDENQVSADGVNRRLRGMYNESSWANSSE